MKLITNPEDLKFTFLQLMDQYSEFHWTSAWASDASKASTKLWELKHKIKTFVVGIHFNQTHPNFIEKFINIEDVKYIKQPSGTFHPKAYLFYNSDTDWRLLIGSANFTQAAFTLNTEFVTEISSQDEGSMLTLGSFLPELIRLKDLATLFSMEELHR